MNLCDLTPEQRLAIEVDKTACLWLWQLKNGKTTKQEIRKMICNLQPDMRELVRERLNKGLV
jgi:hypothetical protein